MHIMVVGLNYKTAPVEVREQVSISDVELETVLQQLRDTRTVLESVVLSTCNRTEIYAVVSSLRAGEDFLSKFVSDRTSSRTGAANHLYVHTGQGAVKHLMRVASGLDSMVVGETQILGQVRNAFLTAADTANTGALLNQLFRRAIQVGKRAQSETGIGQNPVSVSYAAVQLAKKVFGDLRGREVLVLGAGKMSRLTAQHLQASGVGVIHIANRTFARAELLAQEFAGQAVEWDQVQTVLQSADIVISSTGSRSFVLTADTVETALKQRSRRPFVLIDIAVPRDIDPAISAFKNVYLYDIDDLEGVVAANMAERQRQAEVVERIIDTALTEFSDWLSEQEVVPLISAIRAKGVDIQSGVMESLRRKLPELSDREMELIHKHTMSIVNQLLRDPIKNMKDLSIASGGAGHVRVFAELFGVSEEQLREHATSIAQDQHTGDVETAPGFVDLVKQWSEQLLRERKHVSHGETASLHPALQ